MIFRGSGSILLGNPIFLRFFRGGGSGPPAPPPSGSAHGSSHALSEILYNSYAAFTTPLGAVCLALSDPEEQIGQLLKPEVIAV